MRMVALHYLHMIYSSIDPRKYMSQEFKKSLTLFSLTMIAIGAAIGSGIFRAAGTKVGAFLPDHTLIIGVWLLGGLVTLTGALTFAELGTLFTKRGGMYVYIREAFGDLAGFLYGWSLLVVTNTGSIAGLVVVFTDFLKYVVPISQEVLFSIGPIQVTVPLVIQIGTLIVLTLINVFGVDLSKLFTNVFTTTKLVGIAAVIVIGLFFIPDPNLTGAMLDQVRSAGAVQPSMPVGFGIVTAMLTGLVGVLWSYGGWQHTTFVVGEAKDPSRTVPRAMIIGAIVITTVYLLINVAYLKILPMEIVTQSKQIAADMVSVVFPGAAKWISLLICISVLGTTGIYILSCPRIYFAMADDGLFFKKLAEIHPTYKTPANAIVIQSIWAIVLLLFWGAFENLIDYVTFVDWIFYGLTGLSVFVFRKKLADAARPYKVPLYPLIPAFFCIVAFAFVLNSLIVNPAKKFAEAGTHFGNGEWGSAIFSLLNTEPVAGLILLSIGTLVYFKVWRKAKA